MITRLTLLFEGEVLCEVPALVVPPQEEECGGVVDLQRPEVENTLGERETHGHMTHRHLTPNSHTIKLRRMTSGETWR